MRMDGTVSDYLQEYYRSLSEFSDITKSELQRSNLLNSILLMISDQLDLKGVAVKVTERHPTTSLRKFVSVGISQEKSIALLRTEEHRTLQSYDEFSVEEYIIQSEPTMISGSNIRYILKIESKSDILCAIILYASRQRTYDIETINALKYGAKFIANTYTMIDYLDQVRASKELDITGFSHNPLPMLVLRENYHTVRINDKGNQLFGQLNRLTSLNFFENFIPAQTREEIPNSLQALPDEGTLEFPNYTISKKPGSFSPDNLIEAHLYFRKIRLDDSIYYVLSLYILDSVRRSQIKSDLQSDKKSLYQELKSYGELYLDSNREAIVYGKENFFPAAYAFAVNEITGPIVMTSSPDIEYHVIFQDTIKLMAGINTDELLSQGYLTGITPWSIPQGEMRWIAFSVKNEMARGGVEIHMIGLIVKRNLLMIKPELSNTLLGLLLGSMNQYMDLILSDKADFITESYENDRNYSTISMIQNILNELRSGSAEVLAAYSLK